ncbi:hypothetical protein ILT44_21075 [Microvirga sp. BT689]|uniref:hypothetical protein n=1 Tax=Microvirga arvi TaxID=2778731 RepID=UPI0019504AF6|nr:hypothetical protein [Microvirga arvi]MBM6582701.1 hypothetical protein [Microvirga arvi]
MAPKSRLNPNKESRLALKQLQDKKILIRQKVGLRHAIKSDGSVEFLGYDVGYYHMANFHPGVARAHTVVQYNNARAELTATLGTPGYEGHILDISKHFPQNPLATQLLAAARSKAGFPSSSAPTVYGDAILVTDNRMHWMLHPYRASLEDIERCHDMLTTPRDLISSRTSACVFFHEEPNQSDILTLNMHWC